MPFQPFTGNICDYPPLNGYDPATDTYTAFVDILGVSYNGPAYMYVWNAWWNNYMGILQGATLEEISYQFPIWAKSTFSEKYPNQYGGGWGPVGGTGQFEDDGRIVVQDLVIWLIEQSGGSVSYSDTGEFIATGGSIQLPDACVDFDQYGGAHYGSFQHPKDYHPTMAWIGYLSAMGHPMTCDPNIIDPPPPPPDEPQGWTGNLCDYPGIIDEFGNITEESVVAGWAAWNYGTGVDQNLATYNFPDLDGDEVISQGDFIALLAEFGMTWPMSCTVGPPIGPGDPTGPTTGLGGIRLPGSSTKSKKGRVAKENTPPPTQSYGGVRENLYTNGNEYTLPNGEIYIGAYHVHPTRGAMVGAKHTSAPHDALTKLPPLKAKVPPKLKPFRDTEQSRQKRSGQTYSGGSGSNTY
jgi:hypothetical protein